MTMKILNETAGASTIGISGHTNPDGDCVGSCLGLALYLRRMLPEARVDVFLDPVGEALMKNIPGAETIIHDGKTDVGAYDVFIVCDSEKGRTGAAEALFDGARHTVNIDHHISNPGCGKVNYIDPSASSACELVYDVLDPEGIDASVAQALYVGMVTDTGVFRYSNTSEKTMVTAGRLLRYGFNHARIVREVFFECSFAEQKAMGMCLSEAGLFHDGRVICSVLDYDRMRAMGAVPIDVQDCSSRLALTRGVDCSIFLYGKSEKEMKVSLRSNEIVDVAAIASMFGGGGHVRAAGCTLHGDWKGPLETMIRAAGDQLEAEGEKGC